MCNQCPSLPKLAWPSGCPGSMDGDIAAWFDSIFTGSQFLSVEKSKAFTPAFISDDRSAAESYVNVWIWTALRYQLNVIHFVKLYWIRKLNHTPAITFSLGKQMTGFLWLLQWIIFYANPVLWEPDPINSFTGKEPKLVGKMEAQLNWDM